MKYKKCINQTRTAIRETRATAHGAEQVMKEREVACFTGLLTQVFWDQRELYLEERSHPGHDNGMEKDSAAKQAIQCPNGNIFYLNARYNEASRISWRNRVEDCYWPEPSKHMMNADSGSERYVTASAPRPSTDPRSDADA